MPNFSDKDSDEEEDFKPELLKKSPAPQMQSMKMK